MLHILPPKSKSDMRYQFETKFTERIHSLKNMPDYEILEQIAQIWLDNHTGYNLRGIAAHVYMEKIIAANPDELQAWAVKFIRNTQQSGQKPENTLPGLTP